MFRGEQRKIANLLKEKLEEEYGVETSISFNEDKELCGPVYFNFKKKEGDSTKVITISVDCKTSVDSRLKESELSEFDIMILEFKKSKKNCDEIDNKLKKYIENIRKQYDDEGKNRI